MIETRSKDRNLRSTTGIEVGVDRVRHRLFALTVAAACTAPRAATATPFSEVHEEHPGHHHAAHPNLVGARVGFLSVLEDDEGVAYIPGILVGLSYERTLVHEWLEVELSVPVAVLWGPDHTLVALPMDLHFKKPFHPSPRWSPYVALGPAFDLLVAPDTRIFFGASVAVGTYVWPTRRVGVDVEVDYNVISERGRPVHELLLAAGPVIRF